MKLLNLTIILLDDNLLDLDFSIKLVKKLFVIWNLGLPLFGVKCELDAVVLALN